MVLIIYLINIYYPNKIDNLCTNLNFYFPRHIILTFIPFDNLNCHFRFDVNKSQYYRAVKHKTMASQSQLDGLEQNNDICGLCFISDTTQPDEQITDIRKYERFLCDFSGCEVKYAGLMVLACSYSFIHPLAAPSRQEHPLAQDLCEL